ncbi:hypothetical protein H6G81_01060 [Scytonema hofmannii FACHB-248]|uniref:Uncharacterized protein n=1 Tax=Scytonema hofmannii FACHB-248 TaxID=1842502 RepID=A0ABR8GIZ3_9CYAN|nr:MULTISPECIES: hypothetical protein [Nostocales]MBD2603143.1 hypothetical protein [Scytonema hofmannii FACHB-248]
MQSSLKKSEFWFKAMGIASFVNMTCSAIALADMLQPNQQKPLIFPENLKSLAPLKKMQIFKVERNDFAKNTCSIEGDSVCEF